MNWDELEETAKTLKARELIAYMDRHGRLACLSSLEALQILYLTAMMRLSVPQ